MGQEISSDEFSKQNFDAFSDHLHAEMELLRGWFAGGKFADDDLQCGLELEAWLTDLDGRPAPDNSLFLSTLDRKSVVPELSKFNFELNVAPQYLRGNGLRDMRAELGATWQRCRKTAEQLDHRIVSIGVLPTVTDSMLCVENMSPFKRYAALNKQVLKMRGGTPLTLEIEGQDHLRTVHRDLMLESAATSIQVHLKVPQHSAVRFYNASMLASSMTVAMAANAPLLFGRRLWDDTRIPVFEQAVDTAGPFPRVSFGSDYLHESMLEVFERNLKRRVMLPAEMDEPPALMPYVRMHNGTIWSWNRPLIGFEPDGRPHLRIEHRPMSASPSLADLFADLGLYLGLVGHLAGLATPLEADIRFEDCKRNFYRAAKHGLNANVSWSSGEVINLAQLLEEGLLERAMDALAATGLRAEDVTSIQQTLLGRLQTRQTGAAWQRRTFEACHGDCAELLLAYERQQATNQPVHTWA